MHYTTRTQFVTKQRGTLCHESEVSTRQFTTISKLSSYDGGFSFALKTASDSHTNKKDWFTGDQVSQEH